MRLTIVPIDNTVYLDNFVANIDCSSIEPSIHAIQWNGTTGEIEYKDVVTGKKTKNEEIEDINPYTSFITLAQEQEQQAIATAAAALAEQTEFERLLAEGNVVVPDDQTFTA